MTSRPTPAWRVVAEREVSTRLRDKAFQYTLGATLVLVVAAIVLASVLTGRTTSYDVAVTSSAGARAVSAAQDALRASGTGADTVTARTVTDRAEAERLVGSGGVDAALVETSGGGSQGASRGTEIVGDDDVDGTLRRALSAGVAQATLHANADRQGVDLSSLDRGTVAQVRLLDPGPADAAARSGVALGFAVIFLFTALTLGMSIAQSVTQEKESRIVEILAAAVPIRALLWGKVLGNSVLALAQILAVAVVGVVGLAVSGHGALLSGIGPAVAWYVVLFVLGFVSLAALWSVAGSLAARQQDLQSTTLPGQLILFLPYFVAIFGGDQVKTVFSMLPIVSTMIMPGRMAEGPVPAWQVAVAIATTVLAAALFVRIAERVFERTLLHSSGKMGYREALRARA